jgi:hypothetical protein
MRQENSARVNRARPAVERLHDRITPTVVAVASADGSGASLENLDGTVLFTVHPYGDRFVGGVSAVAADVNGDGTPDLITAPERMSQSWVMVYDGKSGNMLGKFLAFEKGFTGGATVAAADLDGDGKAEIVVAASDGGGPRVKVVSGANGEHVLADFMAFDDTNFRGGARIALGDQNGDGTPDLIAVAGPGGGPRVAGFDGKSLAAGQVVHLFDDFMALDPAFRGGSSVAAVEGGFVIGAGPGGSARVQTFSLAGLRDDTGTPDHDNIIGNPFSRNGATLNFDVNGNVITTDPVARKVVTLLSPQQPTAPTSMDAGDMPTPPTSPPPPASPSPPPATSGDSSTPTGGTTDTTGGSDGSSGSTTTPPADPGAVPAGAVAPAAGPTDGTNGQIVAALKGAYTGTVTVTDAGNTLTGSGTIWVDDVRPRAGAGNEFDFVGVEVATVNGVTQPPRTIRGVYVSTTPPAADGTGMTGLFYPNVANYADPNPAMDPALDLQNGTLTVVTPIPGVAVSGAFTKDPTAVRDPNLAVLQLPAVGAVPTRADAAPWDRAAIDAQYTVIAGTYHGTLQIRGTQLDSPPETVDLTVTIDKEAPPDWLAAQPGLVFRGTYTMKVGDQAATTGDLVVNTATSTFGAADGTWSNWGIGYLADGTHFGVGAIAFITPDPAHPGAVLSADVRNVISGGPLTRVS